MLYFKLYANSPDPDQTDSDGAVWSGPELFAVFTYTVNVKQIF